MYLRSLERTTANKEPRPSEASILKVPEWQVESLRVTAFPSAPVAQQQEWWAHVVGSQPVNRQSRSLEGFAVDDGPLNMGGFVQAQLVLQITPVRIDWQVGRRLPEIGQAPTPVGFIGTFPDTVQKFGALMARWLDICPDLTRLAFGGVLGVPVEDRGSGYKLLNGLLPFELTGGESDLIYRINRPRVMEVGSKKLSINRLSTWNVVKAGIQSFQLVISPGVPPSAETKVEGEALVCRVQLDISNAPQNDLLAREDLPELLEVLVASGIEIAQNGDHP